MSALLRKFGKFCAIAFLVCWAIIGISMRPALSQIPAQERANQIAAELAERMGRSLTRPIVVSSDLPSARDIADVLNDERARGWWGVTVPARQTDDPARPGRTRWVPQVSGRMDTCLIILTLEGELLPGAARESLLAHEVFHCFQMDLLGIDDYSRLPPWLKEGSATWVGETLAGGSFTSESYWNRYLQTDRPLLERDYDALGFFAHLQASGVNVWTTLDELLQLPPMLAFAQAARDAGEGFLQTWPMGLSRSPEFGTGWDTTGPGIPNQSVKRPAQAVIASSDRPFRQSLAPTDQRLLNVAISPGDVVQMNVSGYGAIRWGTGASAATTRFSNNLSASYCVGESCQCDDGSSPPGVQSVSQNLAILAVTSTEAPGEIDIRTVESPCETRTTDSSEITDETTDTSATVPSTDEWTGGDRAHGTSYGDPHIITYDGLRYSFQTVGEFLLSKSSDGHFEVQARQKQVPGRQLSLNTAAAMQVGDHRVSIYTQDFPDGRSPLWVDGQPQQLRNGTFPLAENSAIVQLNNRDYVVQWATGESVAIRQIQAGGQTFMNITPYVPKRDAGAMIGLLGDLNANPADDLRIRNGAVLPSRSSYRQVSQIAQGLLPSIIPLNQLETAYFEQLYRQFGDSWRIRSNESLFNYPTGQSTEEFSDRTFPSAFPTLSGVSAAQVNAATRTCRQAGVEDIFLEGCIFDVAATGQSDFARAAMNALADTLVQEARTRLMNEVREQIQEVIPGRIRLPRLPF